MFASLKTDLMDWDFWKLMVAAMLVVVAQHYNFPELYPVAGALGLHTVMPA